MSSDAAQKRNTARLGHTAGSALMGAARLALKTPGRPIGTGHLLVSLIEQDRFLRQQLTHRWADLRRMLAEGPGDADAERIGGRIGQDARLEVEGTIREALWRVDLRARPSPGWTDQLCMVLVGALAAADHTGVAWVGRRQVVRALLGSPESDARLLLDRCGVDSAVLLSLMPTAAPIGDDRALLRVVEMYERLTVRGGRGWASRGYTWMINRLSRIDPMLLVVEMEAVRLAVRLADRAVTTAHLLSAVISVNEQLAEGGVRLDRDDGLRAVRGVTLLRCLRDLAEHAPRPGEESRSPTRRNWRVNRRNPWWTVSAAAAADGVAASGSSGGAVLGRLAGALLDQTAGDRDARAMLQRLRGPTSRIQ